MYCVAGSGYFGSGDSDRAGRPFYVGTKDTESIMKSKVKSENEKLRKHVNAQLLTFNFQLTSNRSTFDDNLFAPNDSSNALQDALT